MSLLLTKKNAIHMVSVSLSIQENGKSQQTKDNNTTCCAAVS